MGRQAMIRSLNRIEHGVRMFGLALLLGGVTFSSFASETEISPERLQAIRKAVEQGKAHKDELAAEKQRVSAELDNLQKELVMAADSLAVHEDRLTALEADAKALADSEAALTQKLKNRRHALAGTLAALQRLGRTPPSALALHSDDALNAARGAMILSHVAPKLEAQARALRVDLTKLEAVRAALAQETKAVARATQDLDKERARLDKLIGERNILRTALLEEAKRNDAELIALSRQAKDLESLIAELEARATRVMPRPKPPLGKGENPDTSSEETKTATLPPKHNKAANLPDLAGSVPSRFAEARGRIRFPAQGRVVSRSGNQDGAAGLSNAAVLETRPGAQVVAPFDGEVRFAGPFRDYGLVLIMEMGDGYHVVLAGMARLNAIVGQRLLAGEPIGIMGSAAELKAAEANGGKGWPRLYVELRKNGQPIDPLPWFASVDEKVSG